MSSLVDSWPSLLALLKDSVQLGLPAPGQFLILGSVSVPSILFLSLSDCRDRNAASLLLCLSLLQSSERVHFEEP